MPPTAEDGPTRTGRAGTSQSRQPRHGRLAPFSVAHTITLPLTGGALLPPAAWRSPRDRRAATMAIPVSETAAAAPRTAVPSSPPPSPHPPPVTTRMDYRVARPRNSGGRFVRLTPAQRNALLAASGPRLCAACGTASTTQWRFWGGDLPGGEVAGAADRWRGTKIGRRGLGSGKGASAGSSGGGAVGTGCAACVWLFWRWVAAMRGWPRGVAVARGVVD